MAVNEELLSFVKLALHQGHSRPLIEETLLKAGWDRDQIKNALSTFADLDFPFPVPKPQPYLSAREAFTYLLLFTTLYICAFNLGALIFAFINIGFPDALADSDYIPIEYETIRWSISTLLIAFPVFLYSTLAANRISHDYEIKQSSKIRKWLTYMTLLLAAGTIMGDMISLIYNFLGGEISWRFILKVLTIGIISSSVLGYYRVDLRRAEIEVKK